MQTIERKKKKKEKIGTKKHLGNFNNELSTRYQ